MKSGERGSELREKRVERLGRERLSVGEARFKRSTGKNWNDDATALRSSRGKDARTNEIDRREKSRRKERAEKTIALDGGGSDDGRAGSGGRRFENEVGSEARTARAGEVKIKFGVGAEAFRRFPTRKAQIAVDAKGARQLRDVVLRRHKAPIEKEKERGKGERVRS